MAANLTLANKNPFSTFDFLGYFIPGAFALGLLYVLSNGLDFDSNLKPRSFIKMIQVIRDHEGYGAFILIVLSYILGHLISYVSSVTVELFYIWCYGYPTDYLLLNMDKYQKKHIISSKYGWCGNVWHVIVCLFLLPLFMCHFLVEKTLGIGKFLSKGIDNNLRICLKNKVNSLSDSIDYVKIDEYCNTTHDVHRIVMHKVYENCQQHVIKYDNYVALYGFLRSITLIFNMAFLYLIYRFIRYCEHDSFFTCQSVFISVIAGVLLLGFLYHWNKETHKNLILGFIAGFIMTIFIFMLCSSDKTGEIIQIMAIFVATYVSYLGFTKFYRRFTLENLMTLLICKDE